MKHNHMTIATKYQKISIHTIYTVLHTVYQCWHFVKQTETNYNTVVLDNNLKSTQIRTWVLIQR